MPDRGPEAPERTTVVVGVDGAGRTHRLDELAAVADGPVLRVGAPVPADLLRELLRGAAADGALVLVDDPHRLDDTALALLAASARDGVPTVVARRPVVGSAALADLDEAAAGQGRVEVLAPLDAAGVGRIVTAVTGAVCPPRLAEQVRTASGGLPAVAVAVASALEATGGALPDTAAGANAVAAAVAVDGAGPPAPALAARLQRRLAAVPPGHTRLARVLALAPDAGDEIHAAASGLDRATATDALGTLRLMGLLCPGSDRLLPAVAAALLAGLAPAERRRLDEDVAHALAGSGGAAVRAAEHLRSARARGAAAAAAYCAAAEELRFTDPQAALGWFEEAQEAGAPVAEVAAGAAEAGALLGLAVDTDPPPGADPDRAARLARVAGALAAAGGRPGRAGDLLLAAPPPGPVLAVPALVAAGRLDEARAVATTGAPAALRLLAAAALAAVDPARGLAAAIDAAEAAERTPPAAVLPDTPHALGACLAVAAGDVGTAVELLARAVRHGTGGPAAQDRHTLLLGWARLRAGRPDPDGGTGRPPGDAGEPVDPTGRDRVLRAAVRAGRARRSGDVAQLRAIWPEVERVLARGALDLFLLEPAEELAVAAARLRRPHRAEAALAGFEAAVTGLGSPPAWEVALGWLHLQVAVAADDPDAAAAAAARVVAAGPGGHRPAAMQQAAPCWADVLAGRVDADRVVAAADALGAAELPWEASRLAGDAAVRVADAVAARRLLERARDLAADLATPAPTVVTGPAPDGDGARRAGLSDREVEVARLVLDGRTHREIGAQLYLSPKTVEHHVARIRTKLGASTRAEFVAALRGLLGGGISPP